MTTEMQDPQVLKLPILDDDAFTRPITTESEMPRKAIQVRDCQGDLWDLSRAQWKLQQAIEDERTMILAGTDQLIERYGPLHATCYASTHGHIYAAVNP